MPSTKIAPAQKGTTDLGALWKKAVEDYMKKTGKDMSHMRAQSVDQVMKKTEKSMEAFGGFRHKGDKIDKVRSAFGRQLGNIQKCVDGLQVVGTALGAFPPAMPVGLVFAACGHLLDAFARVTDDYNRVEAFFSYANRFFERLSLLETKADPEPLALAIVRVFSTQLSVCGIVECMMKENRFKQFLNALWNLEDKELAGAYAAMQASIEELDSTVGFASFNAIKNAQEDVQEVSEQVELLDQNIRRFRDTLHEDVQKLYASSLDLEVKVTQTYVAIKEVQEESHLTNITVSQVDQKVTQFFEKWEMAEKSKMVSNQGERKMQSQKANGKGDIGDIKVQAVGRIKEFFNSRRELFPDFLDARTKNQAMNDSIKRSFVDGTAAWLTKDPDYASWLGGDNPLLCIRGSDGTGKSYIAQATAQKLSSQNDSHRSIVYFYFQGDFSHSRSVQNALACAALQIAESNSRYAEQIAAGIKEDTGKDAKEDEESTWKRFFLSMFKKDSDHHVSIVLDGLDEIEEKEKKLVVQFLDKIRAEKSKISVLVTSRLDDGSVLDPCRPLVVDVTKEKIAQDLKVLIWHRLKTLPRLKKFSHTVKKVILRKIFKEADSFLYVEHMLRRLSYIGREGGVLKDLKKVPANLMELYKLLLDECLQNRTNEQFQALKRLFAFLAFAKRPLTLSEATHIIHLSCPDGTLDIEGEIIGRSSRILELFQAEHLDEDLRDDDGGDDADDSGDEKEPDLEEYQNSTLTFQERSLWRHFRNAPPEVQGKHDLRTVASEAHLMILSTCVDTMIEAAKDPDNWKATDLRYYATTQWTDHFGDMEAETASEETVQVVVTQLHRILTNKNNVSKLFERYLLCSTQYPPRPSETKEPSKPKPGPPETIPWYDKALAWLRRGATLPEALMSLELRGWCANLDRKNILGPLTRGHFNNWLERDDPWWLTESFRFTTTALVLSTQLEINENQPQSLREQIMKVVDIMQADKTNPSVMRAIGTTLCELKWENKADEAAQAEMDKEGIRYLKESAPLLEPKSLVRSSTLRLLANRLENPTGKAEPENDQALVYLDEAMEAFPDLDTSDLPEEAKKEMIFKRLDITFDKGRILRKKDDLDSAMEIFNAARKISPEPLDGWSLDSMAKLFDEKKDADGSGLMNLLKSWTNKERNNWLEFLFEYENDDKILNRAAKLTDQVDLLVDWLTLAERTAVPQGGLLLFNIRAAIAEVHRVLRGDTEKAKQTMREMLTAKMNVVPWQEDSLAWTRTVAWMRYAAIIFSQFHASPDPVRKEELLDELERIPHVHVSDELYESHVGMLVANMLRVLGPSREYYKYMDKIFQACMSGLEDSVSYNDAPSLRLLAKVLASVEGLGNDAQIAYSLQFSILDRETHEKEKKKDGDEGSRAASPTDDANDNAKDDDKEPSVAEQVNGESVAEKPVEAAKEGVDDPSPANPPNADDTQSEPANRDAKGNTKDDDKAASVAEEVNGDSVAEKTVEAANEGNPPNADDAKSGGADEDAKAVTAQSRRPSSASSLPSYHHPPEHIKPMDDEELTNSTFPCEGCNSSFSSWESPLYLCLMCPDADLCHPCYANRMAINRGEKTKKDEPWNQYCDKGHFYIKGPVDKWMGVKNGVMRFLGDKVEDAVLKENGSGEEKEDGLAKPEEKTGGEKEDLGGKESSPTESLPKPDATADGDAEPAHKDSLEKTKPPKDNRTQEITVVKDITYKLDTIPIQEWVAGLRGKWKEAWDRYWVSGGGIKDIGIVPVVEKAESGEGSGVDAQVTEDLTKPGQHKSEDQALEQKSVGEVGKENEEVLQSSKEVEGET
ncbi:hypothetical protein CC80DRAFT_553779 [Byssothecium circinans]|uniref:Fungal STAND N-terminal Goodbye domain-containing protein n=1 Tax=Byssothecium circinans TaxID=147558 RepID=A0A6A5TFH8_9PLEO|nr:hypothetical protein CC80DRAFT_553779 [Byssothecium circinans]